MIIVGNFRVEGSTVGLPLPLPGPSVKRQNPGSTGNGNGKEKAAAVDVEGLLKADPVTSSDLSTALQTTKPSSDGKMIKYVKIHIHYCRVIAKPKIVSVDSRLWINHEIIKISEIII